MKLSLNYNKIKNSFPLFFINKYHFKISNLNFYILNFHELTFDSKDPVLNRLK